MIYVIGVTIVSIIETIMAYIIMLLWITWLESLWFKLLEQL